MKPDSSRHTCVTLNGNHLEASDRIRPAELPTRPGGSGPSRAQALAALGLDVAYVRGEGSRLWYGPNETPVWDFLGGYGATFFGHNHPELTAVTIDFLQRGGVIHAQASRRSVSDRLREVLDALLHAAFGRHYEIVLGSTGAEAVEIAAKHADFAWAARRDETAARVRLPVPREDDPPWSDAARETLISLGIWHGTETLRAVAAHNHTVLYGHPVFLALRGSFHGMTSRALELTEDPGGRFGARFAPSRVRFIDHSSTYDLEHVLADHTSPVVQIIPRSHAWHVETTDWTAVSGFFVEPVQGEGGIHPLDRNTAQAWQAACRQHGVPLIADEIQTGMGRTGTFCFSEQIGISPEYVLLGKSLGGGIAKISAVAIDQKCFLKGFLLQHASTFSEDDLSSGVALRALDLLDEEDALGRARDKGERLERGLRVLAEQYPQIIEDVRGRGLMLGIEWRRQEFDRSHALRFLQEYGWLGYALSAYLLREHGLRVAPPLSSESTIRLEPSYAIPDQAISDLLAGLDQLCLNLEQQDAGALLGPGLGIALKGEQSLATPAIHRPVSGAHVAFIGHFIDEEGVGLWDSGLGRLGVEACRTFLERVHPMAEPLLCHRDHVRSLTGETTTLSFIGIPISSESCYAALDDSDHREALRALIQRAVDLAYREGCSVTGLGGYCSILTRNGKILRTNGMALTTGNGYTVGAGMLALEEAAKERGIVLPDARAAVVGALGNIGSIMARLLARKVGALVLVGRQARLPELEALAGQIVTSLVQEAPDAPIARAVTGVLSAAALESHRPGDLFRRVRRVLGTRCPIDVADSALVCRDAELIAAASNTPGAVIFPNSLNAHPTLILDLAVPGDVHASVLDERPNVQVIRGGVIDLPYNPDWSVPGIPLEPGSMYACMAETALMGLERETSHGSLGSLTIDRVLSMVEAARRHGFDAIRTGRIAGYGLTPFEYIR